MARRNTVSTQPSALSLWDRLFILEPTADLTIQAQLRAQMIDAIVSGRLPGGTPVPGSRVLAQILKISRNTVVIVYNLLAEDGFLTAKNRSGYYVNSDLPSYSTPGHLQIDERQRNEELLQRCRIRPSMHRNISKAVDWQRQPYPFIYGQMDPSLFPAKAWRDCCRDVLSARHSLDWAQDSVAKDDAELIREICAKVLPLRGVFADSHEILITIGAQQALYLIADLLLDERSVVGVEDPGYPDARNIFKCRTPLIRALNLDAEGLTLEQINQCDVIYTTPSHQSPTTITMSMRRRIELLKKAEKHDILIIEDDYEPEKGLVGAPNPALKSLDKDNRVIYVGSLSKSFAPGLRVGYIVAPPALIVELRALQRLMVRHTSTFVQKTVARFLASGHYDVLSRKLIQAHQKRATVLQRALGQHMPMLSFMPITGGTSLWVNAPVKWDTQVLADHALQHGVVIEPGEVHFLKNPQKNYFRLGFGSIPLERIEPGIIKLAQAAAQLIN